VQKLVKLSFSVEREGQTLRYSRKVSAITDAIAEKSKMLGKTLTLVSGAEVQYFNGVEVRLPFYRV
jgi:hypothetical protein